MRRVIGAINMTVDGFCDHTAIDPDAEIHKHYEKLLLDAGVILYGKTTYGLMQYWQNLLKNPSGERSMDDFARAMDAVPKIIFSHSLKETGWESAKLATLGLKEEVTGLKQQTGKDIYVGSRSLIIQLLNMQLLDELQLCLHPVLAAGGLPLFDLINQRMELTLVKTKTFAAGATLFYYRPATTKV